MRKLSLGLDFGTLSVRALLMDVETGEELSAADSKYEHGVMEKALPDGTPLPPDHSLQLPEDYRQAMKRVIRESMEKAGVRKEEIIGIGLDATNSTILPIDKNGIPLCERPEFSGRPQAYLKLWRHHGGLLVSDRLYRVAEERGEAWLPHYGGWLSAELFMPKAVEIAVRDPEVFAETDCILEVGDWVNYLLTGKLTRSLSMAGCNSLYRYETGYPSSDYFRAAYPEAEKMPEKFKGTMAMIGSTAGYVTAEAADYFGLQEGTPVAVAQIDSHAAVVGVGACREGDMVSVIGTTANNILNGGREAGPDIPGTYSASPDASVPGLYGYEGGQNCVGNCFEWFVENMVPACCIEEAEKEGVSIHTWLSRKAEELEPGESGLLALDWFNGVRTPLRDLTLSSAILGMSIRTKPWEVFRALLESVIYGNKRIIDLYEEKGLRVDRIIAAGGIPGKNPLLMQIYADVTGKEIFLSASPNPSTRGAAIMAAAAGLRLETGPEVCRLIEDLGAVSDRVYRPDPSHVDVYRKLYREYLRLSDLLDPKVSVLREVMRIQKETL